LSFSHTEEEKRLQTPAEDAELEDKILTESQTRSAVKDGRAK
jgi:hypothetical protein